MSPGSKGRNFESFFGLMEIEPGQTYYTKRTRQGSSGANQDGGAASAADNKSEKSDEVLPAGGAVAASSQPA